MSKLVEDFGGKLKMVSLMAPQDTVKQSLQENYADFVTTDLLAHRKNSISAPLPWGPPSWDAMINMSSPCRRGIIMLFPAVMKK